MARKKISEFRAKSLLHQSLDLPYLGISFNSEFDRLSKLDVLLDSKKHYVLKVDEGIKRRFKKGLVHLHLSQSEVKSRIKSLQEKGYIQFLIEPYIKHDNSYEKFLAIERVREGLQIYFSDRGGIDIETHEESVGKFIVPYSTDDINRLATKKYMEKMIRTIRISPDTLALILKTFELNYFSFLEINPLIVLMTNFYILDCAVEVDSTAEFFAAHQSVHGSVDETWSSADFVEGEVRQKTEEEKNIEELSSKSQASFKLDILNPNGSIFMLLSGGGASIVLADEVANLGKGKELANYGEYSGNPNAEETYLYTKNLLSLLLKSNAKRKALLIAGGVANFTDVRITFRGIIKALEEVKDKLYQQKVSVFVRRGGPYQEEGLTLMKQFLEKEKLLGEVKGPEMVLTEIVSKALEYLR